MLIVDGISIVFRHWDAVFVRTCFFLQLAYKYEHTFLHRNEDFHLKMDTYRIRRLFNDLRGATERSALLIIHRVTGIYFHFLNFCQ